MVDNVVFWIGAGLIALLLVRQGIVILENTRLARSLALSNERLQYQVLHDALDRRCPTARCSSTGYGWRWRGRAGSTRWWRSCSSTSTGSSR